MYKGLFQLFVGLIAGIFIGLMIRWLYLNEDLQQTWSSITYVFGS